MTAPVTPPALPAVPPTTPTWLVRVIALVVALAGPALAWVDPTGKLDTRTVQAAIIIVFLVVAAAIFLVEYAVREIHHYGLTKIAAQHFVTDTEAEDKQLLAEFKAEWPAAKPALATLEAKSGVIDATAHDVEELKARGQAVPAADKAAIEGPVKEIIDAYLPTKVVPLALVPPPAPAEPEPA